jgi:hypothetical protein
MPDPSGRPPLHQFRGVSYPDRKDTHPLPDDGEDTHLQHQSARKKGEGWGRRTVECVLLLMIIVIFYLWRFCGL